MAGNRKKPRAARTRAVRETAFEKGSDNVFADLGFADAEERLAKARLAAAINTIIDERGWTQEEAANHLQTYQPVISALRRGRLRSLTYDRLVNWLTLLDQEVEIRIRPATQTAPRVRVAVGSR